MRASLGAAPWECALALQGAGMLGLVDLMLHHVHLGGGAELVVHLGIRVDLFCQHQYR